MKKGKDKKDKVEILDSSLNVKEDKKSIERTKAELSIPDPKPERASAILNGELKRKESNG